MKKIIAKILVCGFMLSTSIILLWFLIIEPAIRIYHKEGIIGIITWFSIILILFILVWALIKILFWAVDELRK